MAYEDTEPASEVPTLDYTLKGMNRIQPRTKLERLRDMKKQIEAKLKEVNEAIEALEKNPELTEILNKLERVNV